MKTHGRSFGVFLLLFVVAMCLACSGMVSAAEYPAGQSAGALFQHPKIIHPERVLQSFDQGMETARVIVNLSLPGDLNDAQAFGNHAWRQRLRETVAASQDRVIRAMDPWDVQITNRFTYVYGFSAEVTLEGLEGLVNAPDVVSVEEDRVLYAHLAQGIPLMDATVPRSSYNGTGVAVAICDTGIDYTHPRLGGGGFPNSKVIGGYDCGDNDANPMDQQGHGTACAGIAAGNLGTVGDYIGGVAPGAKLYAVKISYGSGGSAYTSDMIEGWEWCVTHQDDDPTHPIMIISTSFGGGRYLSLCDGDTPAMTAAAANAAAVGITIFVSSGNDGYCNAMGWPACISHVVSVGAVYDAHFTDSAIGWCVSALSCATKYPTVGCSTGYYASEVPDADRVIVYSNTASFLSLLAPSNWATTTRRGGGYWNTAYGFGGTSAACPYAAGAAASLQSASLALNGVFLSSAQVKSTLISTGDPITDGKVNITKPRVNLSAAVNSLGGGCTYSIDPTQASVAAEGGAGSVAVDTEDGCSWTAVSNHASWLHVTSGDSGTGSGTVGYSVEQNEGPVRTGTLTVAGQTFTVEQAAGGECTYAIDPVNAAFDLLGGQGSVAVSATPGCSWTAVSQASWIRVRSGQSGVGNGAVTYDVVRSRTSRTGTVTIAEETFTVNQE
jgi:subtilisin family serine protease